MACFLVPAGEAVVSEIVKKAVEKKEIKIEGGQTAVQTLGASEKISFSRKLGWLTRMLSGGSALLAFEHVWHGEVVPWFPFLSAASNPADASAMLHEMATAGVGMAVLVTAVWVGMLTVVHVKENQYLAEQVPVKVKVK